MKKMYLKSIFILLCFLGVFGLSAQSDPLTIINNTGCDYHLDMVSKSQNGSECGVTVCISANSSTTISNCFGSGHHAYWTHGEIAPADGCDVCDMTYIISTSNYYQKFDATMNDDCGTCGGQTFASFATTTTMEIN